MEHPPPYGPKSEESPHQEYVTSSNTSIQQSPPENQGFSSHKQAGEVKEKTDYGSTGYTPQEPSYQTPPSASPAQGQGYPPQGPRYSPQGQGHEHQGQEYEHQGQEYPSQGQGYQSQGQEYQHRVNTQQPAGYTSQNGNSTTVHVIQHPQPQGTAGVPPVVNSHLVLSIFGVCCFWPIGIFAIVRSSEAQRRYMAGDYVGAAASARRARKLSIAALICGTIVYIVSMINIGIIYSSNRV